MPELRTEDATLHVEVDGEGEPVTVLAHGLTNSCRELAPFTPLAPGTKVRFCFRGHGHSSAPERGYRFADFARDLDAVARTYGATRAIGTSLGAGAICNLLAAEPGRFERVVLLLPAGLDLALEERARFLHTADVLEGKSREEAIEAIVSDLERREVYHRAPWMRDLDRALWADINPEGAARAIREVIDDRPVEDRELLRRVTAPALVICREGDEIHPAGVGRTLADLMPNAELLVFEDEVEMFGAVPDLVRRVGEFLAAA